MSRLYHQGVPPPEKSPSRELRKNFSPMIQARLFVRDQGRCRYTGELLYFPGLMRLWSKRDPQNYTYDPHGKFGRGHMDYWNCFPSIDHIVPLASGGTNEDINLAITSGRLNMLEKRTKSLAELGLTLLRIADADGWDGGLQEFLDEMDADPSLHSDKALRDWYRAGKAALAAAAGPAAALSETAIKAAETQNGLVR